MKPILKFLAAVLTVLSVLYTVAEFLVIPLILVLIGILNSLPWQYYLISIGIYIAIFALAELIGYLIGTALGKRYVPILVKLFDRHTKSMTKDIDVYSEE